jgi:hypothetical protein
MCQTILDFGDRTKMNFKLAFSNHGRLMTAIARLVVPKDEFVCDARFVIITLILVK